MKKAPELEAKSIDELITDLNESRKKIFQMTNDLRASRKLEKPHLIRQEKKHKARLLTAIHQKRRAM